MSLANHSREPSVVGLHPGRGRPTGTGESHDAGEERSLAVGVPHPSGLARGRGRCHGGAELSGCRSGAGQARSGGLPRLGVLAGGPAGRKGLTRAWRVPAQALPPSSLLHPSGPALLDMKALCQAMRSRSQPCPLVRASGSGRGGSVLDVRGRWALYMAEPSSGRQQSAGCLPLYQAPDSSCPSSRAALQCRV